MHRLLRTLAIAARAPIGFVHGLLELTQSGARQSYYRAHHRGVRFEWGVIVDESCDFESPITILRDARIYGGRFGRYTYVGRNSQIENADIGRFCSIGPEVMIGLAAHPLGLNVSTSPAFYEGPSDKSRPTFTGSQRITASTLFADEHRLVTVGHDVWIGARAVLRENISIGNGAVIAAGAVVTRNVPPYAIAAGVPARIIRYRFDAETIASLQRLSWWDRDVDWLRGHVRDFMDCRDLLKSTSVQTRVTCP